MPKFHPVGAARYETRNRLAPSFAFPAAAIPRSQGRRLPACSWRYSQEFLTAVQMKRSESSADCPPARFGPEAQQAAGESVLPILVPTSKLPPHAAEMRGQPHDA